MTDFRRKHAWKQARKRAIRLSDGVCGICGRPIDLESKRSFKDPLSINVDHIVPLVKGGDPYDIDNLRVVHRICNLIKGDRDENVNKDVRLSSSKFFKKDYKNSGIDWNKE